MLNGWGSGSFKLLRVLASVNVTQMKNNWWVAPLFLLSCFIGWIIFYGIQAQREHNAFIEEKGINLGVLNASDAENRMRALRALVDILGPGTRYGVKWKTNKSGKLIDCEFSVGPAVGHDGLLYCEISNKSMQCFAFYHLKPDTLSKIVNNKQSTSDPLKQLEEQGYKKQRI